MNVLGQFCAVKFVFENLAFYLSFGERYYAFWLWLNGRASCHDVWRRISPIVSSVIGCIQCFHILLILLLFVWADHHIFLEIFLPFGLVSDLLLSKIRNLNPKIFKLQSFFHIFLHCILFSILIALIAIVCLFLLFLFFQIILISYPISILHLMISLCDSFTM